MCFEAKACSVSNFGVIICFERSLYAHEIRRLVCMFRCFKVIYVENVCLLVLSTSTVASHLFRVLLLPNPKPYTKIRYNKLCSCVVPGPIPIPVPGLCNTSIGGGGLSEAYLYNPSNVLQSYIWKRFCSWVLIVRKNKNN